MKKKMKIAVDGVIITDGHIKCLWHGTPGFGELDIYANKKDPCKTSVYNEETNTFEVMTEHMGEEFYQLVLQEMNNYLIERSIIVE